MENQPVLREIFKEPAILLYRKRRPLKGYTRYSKPLKVTNYKSRPVGVMFACLFYTFVTV